MLRTIFFDRQAPYPAAVLLSLSFGLTLAGCGDDTEASTSDSATSTTSALSMSGSATSAPDQDPTTTPTTADGSTADPTATPTTTAEPEPGLYEPAWNTVWDRDGGSRWPVAVAFSADGDVYMLEMGDLTGLRKFSADGTQQWNMQFMCEGTAYPHGSLTVAPNGDLVASGSFVGACDLGGSPLDTPANDSQNFIARFTADGDLVWSRGIGDAINLDPELIRGLAVDVAGDVVLAGDFVGSIDLGGGPLTANDPEGESVYVAKLAGSDGAHLWSHRIASTGDERQRSRSLALGPDGSAHALFHLSGALDIVGHPVPAAGDGSSWTVLVGLNSDGTYRYHHAELLEGLENNSEPNSVVYTPDDSLAVYHYLQHDGSITVGEQTHTIESGGLVQLRYAAGGALIDVATVSTDMIAFGLKPAVALATGEIVIAGTYESAPKFGPFTLPAAPADGWNGYTAVLAPSADTLWAFGPPMPASNGFFLSAMAASASRIALTGTFTSVDFGLGQLESPDQSEYLVVFERSP